mgnify:CR=1 FL=1
MAYSIDLSGRVALVTGASSGLGAQFARTLSRAGAAVVLASRRVEKLKELRAEIEGEGGDAHVVALDVTSRESIQAAVARAETEVGSIDILVNNSGVSTTQRVQDVTEDDYDFVFDTNVKGSFFVAQEVGKRMLARAKGAAPGTFSGRIINIASIAGLGGNPPWMQTIAYNTSKGAVVNFTRALACEWGQFGITVNAIAPGFFPSKMSQGLIDTVGSDAMAKQAPLQRLGDEQDLMGATLLFASAAGKHISGQILAVDGGLSAVVGG